MSLDLLLKYGPPVLGLLGLIGSVVFFIVKFLLGRIYGSIDILFGKIDGTPLRDGHEQRIRRLELHAASKEDSKTMVGKFMG